jgi:hypothetical protein
MYDKTVLLSYRVPAKARVQVAGFWDSIPKGAISFEYCITCKAAVE